MIDINKLIPWLLGVVVVIALGFGVRAHVRSDAILDFQLAAQKDSTKHYQAKSYADSVGAVIAAEDRDKAVKALSAQQAKVTALVKASDGNALALSAEHARADSVLADSLATVVQAKAELSRFVATSDSAVKSFTAERAGWLVERSKTALALHADTVQVADLNARIYDLTNLNASIRTQLAIVQRQTPSVVSVWGMRLASAGVGFLAGRNIR